MIFSRDNPDIVTYFEPAVLTPRNEKEAGEDLLLIANFLEGKGNIVQNVVYPDPSKIEQTLVIIKPDNWTHYSSRPGAVIDMFSRTGLRIIGIKIHRFTLAQVMDFYGPVEHLLIKKLAPGYGERAKELLEGEFGFSLSEESSKILAETFGIFCAKNEFAQLVEFMSGQRSCNNSHEELDKTRDVKCMILVYEGENAIKKIRDVLGPTDPLKAPEGTVRREFGAHASDSEESCEREKKIVRIDENPLIPIIEDYLAGQKR
jgi:nucleoside diphosphate kinase